MAASPSSLTTPLPSPDSQTFSDGCRGPSRRRAEEMPTVASASNKTMGGTTIVSFGINETMGGTLVVASGVNKIEEETFAAASDVNEIVAAGTDAVRGTGGCGRISYFASTTLPLLILNLGILEK
ncbi:hypothetical protein Fot_38006 [Forsythia ovata]|uniref:Uncharacterized protein n=1 Tax=Forsythia ovata TaxID=205694 RepID=A0ABD1S232_9LAMI